MPWVDFGAWLLSIAEVTPRLGDSAFEPWLGAIAVIGLVGAVAWLRRWRPWRAIVLTAAALYLAYYAVRMYVLEVEPLLAIVPLSHAVADAFYVLWSSPVGRLSHGEVLDALAELWRAWFMPLLQIGLLFAAASRR